MRIQAPDWLDETAKKYFVKTAKAIGDRLDSTNSETFAVLAHTYSLLRTSQDATLINTYIRLAQQFGLTPKSSRQVAPKQQEDDSIL